MALPLPDLPQGSSWDRQEAYMLLLARRSLSDCWQWCWQSPGKQQPAYYRNWSSSQNQIRQWRWSFVMRISFVYQWVAMKVPLVVDIPPIEKLCKDSQMIAKDSCPLEPPFPGRQNWAEKLPILHWITEKAREFQKTYFCFIDYTRAFDCVENHG